MRPRGPQGPTKAELIEELRPYAPMHLTTMTKAQLQDTLDSIRRNIAQYGTAYPIMTRVWAAEDKAKLE